MSRPQDGRARAREYIRAHPNASLKETVQALGVSIRTVTNARADLRKTGEAPPAFGDRQHIANPVDPTEVVTKATEGTFDVKTTADLNKAIEDELGPDGQVDFLKLKGVLWKVIRRNTDDRIVVAAASALARIQQEAETRPLGPGKPTTRVEALERLSALHRPVGIALVFEAMVKAFGMLAVLETVQNWIGGLNAQKAAHAGIVAQESVATVGAPDN